MTDMPFCCSQFTTCFVCGVSEEAVLVGVASQMLHDQDAVVRNIANDRSDWLAGIASAMQYNLRNASVASAIPPVMCKAKWQGRPASHSGHSKLICLHI